MAKKTEWHDDWWLLLLQAYLKKPVGAKPLYSRTMVDLSLELHVPPQALAGRMRQMARLDTPRLQRIFATYSHAPQRLARAVRLLRGMNGFGAAGPFYEGVEVQETFEKDFRPIDTDPADVGTMPTDRDGRAPTPAMLTMVLDLYFRLTPQTMVTDTPEVQQTARLLRLTAGQVVEILDTYKYCDPYMKLDDTLLSPLMAPCMQVWRRFAGDPQALAEHAGQLAHYFMD